MRQGPSLSGGRPMKCASLASVTPPSRDGSEYSIDLKCLYVLGTVQVGSLQCGFALPRDFISTVGPGISTKQAKKKWNNLKAKYKVSIRCLFICFVLYMTINLHTIPFQWPYK